PLRGPAYGREPFRGHPRSGHRSSTPSRAIVAGVSTRRRRRARIGSGDPDFVTRPRQGTMSETVSHVATGGKRRIAMILSGGGARGAYEVGILWYIFDDLARQRGAPPRVDILCGTRVGAINACY